MRIGTVTGVEQFHLCSPNLFARNRRLLLSVVMLILAFIGPTKADTFPLSLTTGDDYPPFSDLELPQGGLATSLVLNAFEKSGYFVKEIEWLPWKRGYTLTQLGQYHATFPYGWTAERAEFFYYSDPFFATRNYGWTRSGQSNTLTSEVDLHGTVHCNPRGYGDFGKLKELLDRTLLRRETPNSMQDCF